MGFVILVLIFLAIDLDVFHREAHEVSMKESIVWSSIWLFAGSALLDSSIFPSVLTAKLLY